MMKPNMYRYIISIVINLITAMSKDEVASVVSCLCNMIVYTEIITVHGCKKKTPYF